MEYDIKAMLGTYYIWTMFALSLKIQCHRKVTNSRQHHYIYVDDIL